MKTIYTRLVSCSTLAYIHVGLGVWHKDFLREADAIAHSLCQGWSRGFSYPAHFTAIELQFGSPTNLSKHINQSYYPYYFSAHQRNERMSRYQREFGNGRLPPHGRALEHAVDLALLEARNRALLGFHSSDGVYDPRQQKVIACDLSEPDSGLRQVSLTKYKNMMELGQALNINTFVMHPSAHRWIGDLPHRKHRISIFYDSFRDLCRHYRGRGYGFDIAIENLEFDKFPSTAEELGDAWFHCSNIAEQEEISRDRIKICLDIQHLRHSLKIINEQGNYPRFSHTPGIDGLVLGFPNIHRKFLGVSYNACWESLKWDSYDMGHDFLSRYGQFIKVIHTAGNEDNASATHGNIAYHPDSHHIPYWSLHHRRAIHFLMDHGFDGAIIVEDQSSTMPNHIRSGEILQAYIREKMGK